MSSVMAQLGRTALAAEMSTKARAFTDLARIIALSRGQHSMPAVLLKELDNRSRIGLGPSVKTILENHHRVWSFDHDTALRQKAAALAGGTAVGDWSEPLGAYQTLASAFLESLRNFGAFDAM